jgi:hypothetical protein
LSFSLFYNLFSKIKKCATIFRVSSRKCKENAEGINQHECKLFAVRVPWPPPSRKCSHSRIIVVNPFIFRFFEEVHPLSVVFDRVVDERDD